MQWWCVAQQGAWTWTWQPLLGVWVVIGLLAFGYRRLLGSLASNEPTAGPERWRVVSFGVALVLMWASLDWPLGPLGASYLASVHMIQFLVVGVAAPALILLGIPPQAFEGLRRHPRVLAVLRGATSPLNAFVIFNIAMTVTHWPSVVDGLMPTQLGSFVLDAAWLGAGLGFWWPIIAPEPARTGFHTLGKIAYLTLNGFLIRPPFAMMIFSENPIYSIYELAPPPAVDALNDQQLGGAVMKIGVAWIMFLGVAMVYRQWVKLEQAKGNDAPPLAPPGPA